MKQTEINDIKRKVKMIDQLNKEAQGITEKELKVNNYRALNNRINERLEEIFTGIEIY